MVGDRRTVHPDAVPPFVVLASLRLTLWVLAKASAVIVVLLGIALARHVESVRADRRREHVRQQLEPVLSRFLDSDRPTKLAEVLRPAFLRMNAAERPVAAVLVIDLMSEAPPGRIEQLRSELEESGIARSVRPFEVHPQRCMAVGGGIRVANGSRIVGGRVDGPR